MCSWLIVLLFALVPLSFSLRQFLDPVTDCNYMVRLLLLSRRVVYVDYSLIEGDFLIEIHRNKIEITEIFLHRKFSTSVAHGTHFIDRLKLALIDQMM